MAAYSEDHTKHRKHALVGITQRITMPWREGYTTRIYLATTESLVS
jgi:hypothetical protein